MSKQSSVILLVEDNVDHAELILRAFQDRRTTGEIYHVPDGEVALDYLFRQGPYANPAKSPRPYAVLLDLRLPKIDGLEVLKEIKRNTELRCIPVIILTTSEASNDLLRACEYQANSYLVKPVDFNQFIRLMDDFKNYWLKWNHQPQF